MSKHTPGPWHVEPTVRQVILSAQGTVASPWMHDKIGALESSANARLIAAAPELLQALLHVMPHVGTNYSGQQRHDILEPVRAAIAKARGE